MINDAEQSHAYAQNHTRTINPHTKQVLAQLERTTHLKVLSPQMLSGPLQGEFLALISQITQPRLVAEIGTFTGYSAICLAQGLHPEGQLHTIEYDEELEPIIRDAIQQANLQNQIHLHIGDAKNLIAQLPNNIDLAFIDADKLAYEQYYEALLPKMSPNGLILIDNVLWHGKVYNPNANDPKTQYLRTFNQKLYTDPRVNVFLMPLRDGLFMVRKK